MLTLPSPGNARFDVLNWQASCPDNQTLRGAVSRAPTASNGKQKDDALDFPHDRNTDPNSGPSRTPSRRGFLGGGALGLAALALAGCTESSGPAPEPSTTRDPADPQAPSSTTLESRVVAGERLDPDTPYRRLALDGPEKLVVREELHHALPNRGAKRKTLAAFAHITDTHILDPTSPAHMSYRALGAPEQILDEPTYYFRPQESMTVQVMDAMIRKLNAIGRGPVGGKPFDFYVSTGDASDNRGTNEILAFIDVLNGRTTSAFAYPGSYDGPQSPKALPDAIARLVWQPMPPKGSTASAEWTKTYGFPTSAHVLADASRPVPTEGARVPWYSGFGNHDRLAHTGGGDPASPSAALYAEMAVSGKLPVGLPTDKDYAEFMEKLKGSTQAQVRDLLADIPGRSVKASTARRPMSKTEFVAAHLLNPGPHGPAGHGFTAENAKYGTTYYRFQLAEGIVGLMLDTTDPSGGGKASLDAGQVRWLRQQLDDVSSFRETGDRSAPTGGDDQLVVLFSHHPSSTFGKPHSAVAEKGAITDQQDILELLGEYPNVVLWINGHLHRNKVWARRSRTGDHGFWEVNTASHIDFPQQSRTVEILDNNDGTLSIFGVMVDHSDARPINYDGTLAPADLARFSSELALNSPKPNISDRAGTANDRNVELLLPKPF